MKKIFSIILGLFSFFCYAQSYISDITIRQLTDGSGLVEVCYRAHNLTDSIIAVNMQSNFPDSSNWNIAMVTLLDTISEFSGSPNYGWRVSASESGIRHCFLWDMNTDIGSVENCGFQTRFAVFDSMLHYFELADSFSVIDTADTNNRAFGLGFRHGELWVLFHDEITHECWVRPYSLPDLIPGDSLYVGEVAIGPSDIALAGDRLFWTEDTRVLLKEFDFETGESNVVRGDWWSLPGTSNHLAGVAFDGEKLWVCFCEGTFIALDTADFSLVDTMFFPEFGGSVPATCADGLAWGLSLLWCYSNDNIIYAIDVETKSIVYTIPTGDTISGTGPEGCAWDGVNLWIVDYARGFVYMVSLFEQIRFHYSSVYCLDNIAPRIEWRVPSCPDFSDTFATEDTVEFIWSAVDSNLNGGFARIIQDDDTIATIPSTDTTTLWITFPWHGWDGYFELFVGDSFGNISTSTSCRLCIQGSQIGEGVIVPDEFMLSIAPNPFNDKCMIKISSLNQQISKIEIFNLNGKLVDEISSNMQKQEIADDNGNRTMNNYSMIWQPDVSDASNIFLMRITTQDGRKATRKIIYLK